MNHRSPSHSPVSWFSVGIAFVVMVLGSPRLSAQVVVADQEGDALTIQFDEIDGTPVGDFIKAAEQLMGVQIAFEDVDVKDVRLRLVGPQSLKKGQFWSYFQAVLHSKDFVMVPYGHPNVPGRPSLGDGIGYFTVVRANGGSRMRSGYIRSCAPIVTPDQLKAYRGDAAFVVTTSFHLEHVNAQEMVNMLQTYFSDPMLESVRAVSASNSLVATGYAPSLVGVAELLKLIDVPPTDTVREVARIELKHAIAQEIRPILEDFLGSEDPRRRPGVAQQMPQSGTPAPEPVIQSDMRTNAILVLGTEEERKKVREYVKAIDVQVGGEAKAVVVALQYANAAELAGLLRSMIQDGATRVVPDERTNALVISATAERLTEMKTLLAALDVRVDG